MPVRTLNVTVQRGGENRVLALLSEEERAIIVADTIAVSLPLKKEIYRDDEPIDAVYFPLDCVISIVAGAGDGGPQVEVGIIGKEGLVGADAILGSDRAIGANVVQLAGEALRMSATAFRQHAARSPRFERVLRRYTYALTRQIVVGSACDRLHTMEERCARWLLMLHDRSARDSFNLTQGFLSEMLGVRRATVNLPLGAFKTAGLIRYARGRITIVNRPGLESATCPCYEQIRREYERLSDEAV